MHKRYLLFDYDRYYPTGGLSDLKDSFDTIEEAQNAANQSDADYRVIYDRIEGKAIEIIPTSFKEKEGA